jgi:hypothetical protein
MSKINIDVSREVLNKLDSELIALSRMLIEAQSMISVLKFASKTLRDYQETSYTKH